jgi:ring-1,2-phenylacetyl-CoA epoxidase subunit PaaD
MANDPATTWRTLGGIADPEVPVLSIVELGIVRDVDFVDDEIVVAVTPTYSGCPAMHAIEAEIREKLGTAGTASVRINTRLAPPWTTDWIAPEARARLREFGIAPPNQAARIDVSGIGPLRHQSIEVACPRCGSKNTTLLAQFGSTACKAQYRCDDCLEPFDYFKAY